MQDEAYQVLCTRPFQPLAYQPRATYANTLRRMDATYRAMWQARSWDL